MKFDSYSDTGEGWLGVAPSHWQKRRLKFTTTLINEKVEATDLDVKYIGLEHIQSWTGKLDLDDEASSEGTVNAFVEGDVLFGKLRPYLAKVYLAEIDGICSTEALVLRAQEELLPQYLKYYLLSESTIENINSSTYGSKMPRANWEFIGGQLQLLPSKNEQVSIANFLDEKTAHIDTLIEKKRKLLKLLAEKRTAIITNAVTKGINLDAPMKDSGIEWLGEIPEHWKQARLKNFSCVIDCKHRTPVYVDDGIPLVSTTEIKPWSIDLKTKRRVDDQEFESMSEGGRRLQRGDIIYSRNASVGSAAVVRTDDKLCLGQDLCIIRSDKLDVNYLEFFLNSDAILKQLDAQLLGSTFKRINVQNIKGYDCILPPFNEQKNIAKYLVAKCEKFDRLIARVKMGIQYVQEYRSALITEAVTGKIKVA